MSTKTEIGNVRLYLFWSLLKIPRFFSITGNRKQKIWLKQLKAAPALDFSYFQHASKLVTHHKSVTVVDTISTTVTFYLLPFGVCIWNEIRNIPNIFSHKQILCPELLQPWAEKTGLGTTEIVIRIETINYYFLYI